MILHLVVQCSQTLRTKSLFFLCNFSMLQQKLVWAFSAEVEIKYLYDFALGCSVKPDSRHKITIFLCNFSMLEQKLVSHLYPSLLSFPQKIRHCITQTSPKAKVSWNFGTMVEVKWPREYNDGFVN